MRVSTATRGRGHGCSNLAPSLGVFMLEDIISKIGGKHAPGVCSIVLYCSAFIIVVTRGRSDLLQVPVLGAMAGFVFNWKCILVDRELERN